MDKFDKDAAVELTQLSFNESPTRLEKTALIPSLKGQIKPLKDFFLFLSLLLKKNYLVHRRSLRTTIFQIISPFLVSLMMFYWQYFSDSITQSVDPNPPVYPAPKLDRCFYNRDDPNGCTTLAYAVVGEKEPWIDYVVEYVAYRNDLVLANDVKYLGQIEPSEFNHYLTQNMNRTQVGVIFCTGEYELAEGITVPCYFEKHKEKKLIFYTILFNATVTYTSNFGRDYQFAEIKDPVASALKISIDSGIAHYFSPNNHLKYPSESAFEDPLLPNFNVWVQDFPKTFFRFFVGADMMTRLGAFHYFIPYMILFISTILELVREKHKRLRQGLAVMGMTPTAYWASWIITVSIMVFLVTINILISGHLLNFPFFMQTPTPILMLMFLLFGFGMQTLAFFISTLVADMTTGYVVAYGVLLLGIVMEFFLSNPYVVYILYLSGSPFWWPYVRGIFQLYPAFSYSKIFADITFESGKHYDLREGRWVEGTGFTYDDLDKTHSGVFPITGITYHVPPPRDFFYYLVGNAILYLTLTWYFDNIIAHNRGAAKSPLFFLTKEYWTKVFCDKKQKVRLHEHQHSNYNYDNMNIADSVKAEKERVLENQRNNNECFGLRIIGLNKVYNQYCTRKNKSVHAVRDVFLEVDDGELLSLLGHNGAGKTTLIGVLTGLFNPTSGTAEICNYNIQENMNHIQKIMGVCPQFDILWDELTAEEHLRMFAKLKKIPDHLIPFEIETRLKEVNLLDVQKARAGTFSGGMKRRLSMAIAFTGNPRVVFLDEPTTGMDPKNRRAIWDLILKMKKGRVVILTTHAMEEADVLSDRIAVIVDGMLKCIGTSLYLKNNFGDGYRLNLVTEVEHVQELIESIKTIVPSGKILDSSGGSIIIGVPIMKIQELQTFFRIMENKDTSMEALAFKNKIKDWGLSNTTLEEVFMKVKII